jgi:YfiH family protein
MVFEFSKEVKSKKIKIIFSNEQIDNINPNKLQASMQQTHSTNVKIVDKSNLVSMDTDGIFTKNKDISLKIKTADCLPIFFYNESPFFIGVVHAGWKGLKEGIIENAYAVIRSNIKDISTAQVLIGPSISQKNYEVQDEFIDYFGSKFIANKNGKLFLDLQYIAASQLKSLGVENVKDVEECTYENELYHSYRRDKTSRRLRGWIYYE